MSPDSPARISPVADYIVAATGWLEHGLTRLRQGHGAGDAFAESRAHYAAALECVDGAAAPTPLERVAAHIGLTEVALAMDDADGSREHWDAVLVAMRHDQAALGALGDRMRRVAQRHAHLGHEQARSLAVELADEALDGSLAWSEGHARQAYDEGLRRLGRRDVLGAERFLNIAETAFEGLAKRAGQTRGRARHVRTEGFAGLTLVAIALGERGIASLRFDRLTAHLAPADGAGLPALSARYDAGARACILRGDSAGGAQAARFAGALSSSRAAALESSARRARATLAEGITLLGASDAGALPTVARAATMFRKLRRAGGADDDPAHVAAKLEAGLGSTVAAVVRGDRAAAEDGWRQARLWAASVGDGDGWVRAWEVMDEAAAGLRGARQQAAARAAARFAHQCFPTPAVRQARAEAAARRSNAS